MAYWYWSGGVAILGLALGALLFFLAYWSGKRQGRRRARQEKEKDGGKGTARLG